MLPVAAVLGAEVDVELLTQVLQLPEDEVALALDEAVSAGLLVESGRSWAGSYAFPHQLMRESLAAEVSGLRLRSLHLRAARAPDSRDRDRPRQKRRRGDPPARRRPRGRPVRGGRVESAGGAGGRGLYAWDEAIEYADAAVALLEDTDPPTGQAEAAVTAALLRLKSSRRLPRGCEPARDGAVAATSPPVMTRAAGLVHSRLGGALCLHHSVMDIPRALEHFAAAERLLPAPERCSTCTVAVSQAAMFGLRTALLVESAAIGPRRSPRALGRRDLAVVAGWAQAWAAVNQGRLSDAEAIWERSLGHRARAGRPLPRLDAGERGCSGGQRLPLGSPRRRGRGAGAAWASPGSPRSTTPTARSSTSSAWRWPPWAS